MRAIILLLTLLLLTGSLFSQSKRKRHSPNRKTIMTYRGVLHEGTKTNKLILITDLYNQKYILSKTDDFRAGDTVSVTGYSSKQRQAEKKTKLRVTNISEVDCCLSEYKGDISGDGTVDISDVVMFITLKLQNFPNIICYEQADINGDSFINENDLDYLLEYIFKEGPYPVPCELR